MANKYGLDRNIPNQIKRQVRQRCGFGCVICGLGFYEYEHVDPPFEEATSHNPDKIALLCPNCHGRVTRKKLSKNAVKKAMQSPKCFESNLINEEIEDTDIDHFILAGNVFKCGTAISCEGFPVLKILPPEESGGPGRVFCTFYDSKGNKSLIIHGNQWIANPNVWDLESVGQNITIREKHRKINLKLKIENKLINIISMDMKFRGRRIICRKNEFIVYRNGLNLPMITISGSLFEGGYGTTGISI